MLLLLMICFPLPIVGDSDTAEEYYSLVRQARDGDGWGGVSVLEDFVTRYPDDSLADDALFEIGRIYEERLADYDQAIATYERLLELYPRSKGARRARPRLENLRADRAGGDEPLRRYRRILRRYAQTDPESSLEGMKGVVRDYPQFSKRDEAIYWIGDQCFRLHRYGEARDWYLRVVNEYPNSRAAFFAVKGLGDVHMERGFRDLDEARAWYSRLADFESVFPFAPQAVRQNLEAVDWFEGVRNLFYAAVLYFLVCCVFLIARTRWRERIAGLGWLSMIDLILYLCVAFVLGAVLAWKSPHYAKVVASLIAGTSMILFLNRMFLEGRDMTVFGKAVHLAMILLLIVAMQYSVFYLHDLVNISWDTLRADIQALGR